MLEVVDNKMPTVVKAFPSGVIVAYENNSIPLFIAVPRLGIVPEVLSTFVHYVPKDTKTLATCF